MVSFTSSSSGPGEPTEKKLPTGNPPTFHSKYTILTANLVMISVHLALSRETLVHVSQLNKLIRIVD